MVIVTGHLIVEASDRTAYLEECRSVVELGRTATGSLDFCLSPDLLDPTRINILERWESPEALAAFRGDGTPDDLATRIRSAHVADYVVTEVRPLT